MLSGENIVCFAPDPWGDIWRNRHRLLSIFARSNKVVYVEPRTTARLLVRKLAAGDPSVLRPWRRRVEEVRENLFVYHDPVHLPRTSKGIAGRLVDRLRDASLKRALRELGISRPILWLVRPDCHDVPGKLDEKLLLYQVVDDYLSYAGVTARARERLDREERSIGARADLVVVTAEHLLDIKRHLSPSCIHVRNGVDAQTIEEGRRVGGALAPDLAKASRPIFGYIGGVTEKLDFELLLDLAARLESSGGTLALVGPVHVKSRESADAVQRLRGSKAVTLVGQRPAGDMPMFLRAFDVGLIPYKLGDQARSIDPLKLYEYLAFGKPVAAVDIPSLRAFRSLVGVASSREGFLELAIALAKEDDEALALRRREAAAENTWERRAEQISQAIEGALRMKARPVIAT